MVALAARGNSKNVNSLIGEFQLKNPSGPPSLYTVLPEDSLSFFLGKITDPSKKRGKNQSVERKLNEAKIIATEYTSLPPVRNFVEHAKVEVKVVFFYSPDIHDWACSTDFTFPLAR